MSGFGPEDFEGSKLGNFVFEKYYLLFFYPEKLPFLLLEINRTMDGDLLV